jgi:hypothetical protein
MTKYYTETIKNKVKIMCIVYLNMIIFKDEMVGFFWDEKKRGKIATQQQRWADTLRYVTAGDLENITFFYLSKSVVFVK